MFSIVYQSQHMTKLWCTSSELAQSSAMSLNVFIQQFSKRNQTILRLYWSTKYMRIGMQMFGVIGQTCSSATTGFMLPRMLDIQRYSALQFFQSASTMYSSVSCLVPAFMTLDGTSFQQPLYDTVMLDISCYGRLNLVRCSSRSLQPLPSAFSKGTYPIHLFETAQSVLRPYMLGCKRFLAVSALAMYSEYGVVMTVYAICLIYTAQKSEFSASEAEE